MYVKMTMVDVKTCVLHYPIVKVNYVYVYVLMDNLLQMAQVVKVGKNHRL